MNLSSYIKDVAKDELRAIRDLLIESKWVLWVLVIFLTGIIVFLDPFPNKEISIGTGNPGSVWEQAGISAKNYLGNNGVSIQVVTTEGAINNIQRLINPDDPINMAFTYGVALNDEQKNKILSLGSVTFEPIWIFYNKKVIAPFTDLKTLAQYRIGLGPKGSGSYAISKAIFKIYGMDIDESKSFSTDQFDQQLEKFRKGDLDGFAVVTTVSDPIVQKLIRSPDIGLFSFSTADAFPKISNSFESVQLPAGSISMSPVIPTQTISLVATTSSIAIKKDLHPDLQLAALMALKEINRNSDNLFFAKRDAFPAYVDPAIPISPVAAKFYDYGPPHTMRYFPLWLGGFVDRAWLLLLGLFAIFYPLSKLNLHVRKLRYTVLERTPYEQLLEIDALVESHKLNEDEKIRLAKQLDEISSKSSAHQPPVGEEKNYFFLMLAIDALRIKISRN